uniref:Uncharacterized protein n=1 Tax=Bartonella schoenbuchensis (strain DSM 13525 / NCTC 13165 / R1) TaxID=687861 RepID=E6Z1C5_BARSR|nr:hypothetical protein BARSC_190186 [Bartonella schoenbuchensis R1]
MLVGGGCWGEDAESLVLEDGSGGVIGMFGREVLGVECMLGGFGWRGWVCKGGSEGRVMCDRGMLERGGRER